MHPTSPRMMVKHDRLKKTENNGLQIPSCQTSSPYLLEGTKNVTHFTPLSLCYPDSFFNISTCSSKSADLMGWGKGNGANIWKMPMTYNYISRSPVWDGSRRDALHRDIPGYPSVRFIKNYLDSTCWHTLIFQNAAKNRYIYKTNQLAFSNIGVCGRRAVQSIDFCWILCNQNFDAHPLPSLIGYKKCLHS